MIARALWLGVLLMVSPVVANDATATSAVVAKTAKNEPLPFDVGGSFSLVDHTGTPRRESDFHGQAQIVYFGYTACPRICSTALLNIAAALDDLAASGADVGAIFITIDPVHDTPDRLADFVARIHPRLAGLTGDVDEIERVQREWRIGARRVDGVLERLFDHAPIAYLMGPEGDVLTLFPPILPPERLAAIILGYL